jgi:MoaA/NifB/PqqE/SkfB family radical SAM enzyme
MDPALFRKIVDDLAEIRPRRVSPYLMNEPLLDPRLPEFVRYIAGKIPDTTTLVTTNGVCLDEACTTALIDAGLKRIKVSLQSLDPQRNRSIMGPACDADKIVANVLNAKRLIKEKGAGRLDLRVSMIVMKRNRDEIDDARRFWKRHGIRLVTSVLENRGGNIKNAAELNPHAMMSVRRDCIRPSREMCILFNGDVVLCCVDWFRTVVLGNAAAQSIRDIWHGSRLMGIREALRNDDAASLPEICRNCSESAQSGYHRRGVKGFVLRWIGAKRARVAAGATDRNDE